jgi:hypothetical protein
MRININLMTTPFGQLSIEWGTCAEPEAIRKEYHYREPQETALPVYELWYEGKNYIVPPTTG